jgi:hypothetical protein
MSKKKVIIPVLQRSKSHQACIKIPSSVSEVIVINNSTDNTIQVEECRVQLSFLKTERLCYACLKAWNTSAARTKVILSFSRWTILIILRT